MNNKPINVSSAVFGSGVGIGLVLTGVPGITGLLNSGNLIIGGISLFV